MREADIYAFILEAKKIYGNEFIPLHRPIFEGNERKYLVDCIDSNFVSSVGERVTELEQKIASYTGANFAVATVNGTAALHIAIKLSNVNPGDQVITQPLTFIATCNAISYVGAEPLFIDVDLDTMGLSPSALKKFLNKNAIKKSDGVFNKITGKKISACIPMHTFGLPCRIKEINAICSEWGISLIEDAAESLGSYVGSQHTGNFSSMAAFSFNGNKVITTGGGGMLITNNEEFALRAKHITTTAKIPHPYKFIHDEIGYNYRMPNLNAALGCAQMEYLDDLLKIKKKIAYRWHQFFSNLDLKLVAALDGYTENNWLNTIILDSQEDRNNFLKITNDNNVMTRPVWSLMPSLPMFKKCQSGDLKNSKWLEDRLVNIPSSVPEGEIENLLK